MANGIVSALHQHCDGRAWPAAAIAVCLAEIEAASLRQSVVESIPVPNAIKQGSDAGRGRIER